MSAWAECCQQHGRHSPRKGGRSPCTSPLAAFSPQGGSGCPPPPLAAAQNPSDSERFKGHLRCQNRQEAARRRPAPCYPTGSPLGPDPTLPSTVSDPYIREKDTEPVC